MGRAGAADRVADTAGQRRGLKGPCGRESHNPDGASRSGDSTSGHTKKGGLMENPLEETR
jgi:hypothetical protein